MWVGGACGWAGHAGGQGHNGEVVNSIIHGKN